PVPTTPTTRVNKDHSLDNAIGDIQSGVPTRRMTVTTDEQGFISATYEEKTHVDLPRGKKAIGTKWVFRNKKDERGIVIRDEARLVAQGCNQEEGIDYDEVFAPVARIEAIRLFLAYVSFIRFLVYQMDVKSAFLYGRIEEEVYVCQPLGFEDPDYPDKVNKVEKALNGLHQALRACQDKYFDEILRKFKYKDVKPASTSMDKEKALLKDSDDDDVNVHLYMSMIRSLSQKDLSILKRTSQTRPLHNMVAFLKKPQGSEDFHQIVDFLKASHIRTLDNGEIELNTIVDGQVKTITEASVRRHLKLADADGISTLPTTKIFEQLASMGIPRSNVPSSAADEAITQEMHDGLRRATTIASSLATEQGSGNISKTQTKTTPSGPSSSITSSKGGFGCHFTIEKEEEESLDHDNSPKQGRMIEEINKDENVNLVKSSEQGERKKEIVHPLKKGQDYLQSSLIKERRLAAKRAEEKRNKPPTHTQQRTYMSNYLKYIGGYTLKQLKQYSFKEIEMLFDNTMESIRRFVLMESEGQAGGGSSKEGESLKRSVEEELG
nr:putative ribonuclease H-like domain-containing protein [Tanacetum cinerariifolium]